MPNCQNNMYYTRRRFSPSAVPACNSPKPAANIPHPQASCSCKMNDCPDTRDFFHSNVPIAMAYVPWQHWNDLYDLCSALSCGTLFSELNKPFSGKGGCHR